MRKTILGILLLLVAYAPGGQAEQMLAVTRTGTSYSLIGFDTSNPTTHTSTVALNLGGAQIYGIDLRPANAAVYALSSAGLYRLNLSTGAGTLIGGSLSLSGSAFGFDFNPVTDRIQVMSNTGQRLIVNPDTGVVESTTTGLSTAIVGSAFSNNLAGASSTTLYGLDGSGNLYTQDISTGAVASIGGIMASDINPKAAPSFDISGKTGLAYYDGGNSGVLLLGSYNFSTGEKIDHGIIAFFPVDELVGLTAIPEPSATWMVLPGVLFWVIGKRRRRR